MLLLPLLVGVAPSWRRRHRGARRVGSGRPGRTGAPQLEASARSFPAPGGGFRADEATSVP